MTYSGLLGEVGLEEGCREEYWSQAGSLPGCGEERRGGSMGALIFARRRSRVCEWTVGVVLRPPGMRRAAFARRLAPSYAAYVAGYLGYAANGGCMAMPVWPCAVHSVTCWQG